MYYYIFDPPRGPQDYQRTAQIKDKLTTLGIAGEMTSPMPGRDVPDLVANALAKRYGTVVVVGDSPLINQVARELLPHDLVMGIIPLHPNKDIHSLIGSNTWEAAAEQLKRRRWHPVRLGTVAGNGCFLTPATLVLPSQVSVTLHTADWSLSDVGPLTLQATPVQQGEASRLSIMLEHPEDEVPKGFLSSIFGSKKSERRSSRFVVDQVNIETPEPVDVNVAGSVLHTAPLTLATQEKPLRLVTGSRGGAES